VKEEGAKLSLLSSHLSSLFSLKKGEGRGRERKGGGGGKKGEGGGRKGKKIMVKE
jgi:hypothetical protein